MTIPGRGPPIKNATILVHDSIIVYVGPTSCIPLSIPLTLLPPAVHVSYLLPGLWDSHAHFFGSENYTISDIARTEPVLAGARISRDLLALLNAGFTSVRELGGYGASVAPAVDSGWLLGPNVFSTVAIISPTAGHADARGIDQTWFQTQTREGGGIRGVYTADGQTEMVKAVRTLRRRGARTVKIAVTGGVASLDGVHEVMGSEEEWKSVVDEANRWGMSVAAHAHGNEGIRLALKAGVSTIEHGSWLDEDTIEEMKKKDTILVATRAVLTFGRKHREMWSEDAYQKLVDVDEASKKSYKRAIKAGIKIALGTDLGLSTHETKFNHGMNGLEFGYAVEAGLTPLQAIEAGTANGAETLGKKVATEIKRGQLKECWIADMIALSENPLENISLLAQPEKIIHVWKGGKHVKKEGKTISLLD